DHDQVRQRDIDERPVQVLARPVQVYRQRPRGSGEEEGVHDKLHEVVAIYQLWRLSGAFTVARTWAFPAGFSVIAARDQGPARQPARQTRRRPNQGTIRIRV